MKKIKYCLPIRKKSIIYFFLSLVFSIITNYFIFFNNRQRGYSLKIFVVNLVLILIYFLALRGFSLFFCFFKIQVSKNLLIGENPIIIIIHKITLACLFWVFLNIIILNRVDIIHYNIDLAFLFSIFILFLLFSMTGIIKNICEYFIKHRDKMYIMLALVIATFSITQLIIAYGLQTTSPNWDSGVVFSDVIAFMDKGKIVNSQYYVLYPNNLGLLSVLILYFKFLKVFGVVHSLYAASILNVVVMNISVLLIYLICEKVIGIEGAITSLFFSFIFVILSCWVTTPYTDILGMIYPLLILYLYLKSKEIKRNKVKLPVYILIGIVAMFAYKMKPTSLFVMIAIIMVLIITNIKHPKKFALKCALMLLGLIFSLNVFNYSLDNSGILNHKLKYVYEHSTPPTYFLMIGMQKQYIKDRGALYGAVDAADARLNNKSQTKENRIKQNIPEIKKRLREFGFKEYLKFLSNKASWIFGDGTFYAYGEGDYKESKLVHKDRISKNIQNVMYPNSDKYIYFAHFLEGAWIVLIFFIVFPLFLKEKYKDKEELSILRITILGVFIFLLFFEGRSRYLYNNIGIFIITSVYGYNLCKEKVLAIIKKS
ncbi:hypothetical protein CLFE_029840 [Clostridium felsineum DSM 794]|nr:hypothetical protein CLFE_029840 [Clostridium felsineum DSM 794]